MTSITFTEDERDLISQDFLFNKGTIGKRHNKKKKITKEIKIINKNESSIELSELSNDMKDILLKNAIIKERLVAIEKILTMYPNLKKDKRAILECVLGQKQIQRKHDILEKIINTNKNIYKDEFGNILDEKVNLIGFVYKEKDTSGKIATSYIYFNEVENIKIKFTEYKNNLNTLDKL